MSPFSSHLYSPSSNSSQDPIAGKVSSQNLDFKLKPKPLPRFPSKVAESCFRWDKKPSIRGERSKLLFPGSSHLFVLERPTFVIFERPPLIALLSLLQADTITMLHIPGEQISYSRSLGARRAQTSTLLVPFIVTDEPFNCFNLIQII